MGRLGSLTVFQGGSGAKVHAAQVLHGAAGLLAGVLPLQQEVLGLQVSVQNAPAHAAHPLQPLSEQPRPSLVSTECMAFSPADMRDAQGGAQCSLDGVPAAPQAASADQGCEDLACPDWPDKPCTIQAGCYARESVLTLSGNGG